MASRQQYAEEFKRNAVRLLLSRGTRSVAEIAEQLGVSQGVLHRWQRKYEAAARAGAVAPQYERKYVEKMRRRLRELEQENALLKRAATLFAKEAK